MTTQASLIARIFTSIGVEQVPQVWRAAAPILKEAGLTPATPDFADPEAVLKYLQSPEAQPIHEALGQHLDHFIDAADLKDVAQRLSSLTQHKLVVGASAVLGGSPAIGMPIQVSQDHFGEGPGGLVMPISTLVIDLPDGTKAILVSNKDFPDLVVSYSIADTGVDPRKDLQVFSMDGEFLGTCGESWMRGTRLARDQEGNIYLTKNLKSEGVLAKLSPQGKMVWSTKVPRNDMTYHSVAVTSQGVTIYVENEHALCLFDKDTGQFIKKSPRLSEQADVPIITGAGEMVIGCSFFNEIFTYSPDSGELKYKSLPLDRVGFQDVGRLCGIAADMKAGVSFLACDNRILVYDSHSGAWGELVVPDFPRHGRIYDLCFDEQTGNLLVSHGNFSNKPYYARIDVLSSEVRETLIRYYSQGGNESGFIPLV